MGISQRTRKVELLERVIGSGTTATVTPTATVLEKVRDLGGKRNGTERR
jgi:hypothetical protein